MHLILLNRLRPPGPDLAPPPLWPRPNQVSWESPFHNIQSAPVASPALVFWRLYPSPPPPCSRGGPRWHHRGLWLRTLAALFLIVFGILFLFETPDVKTPCQHEDYAILNSLQEPPALTSTSQSGRAINFAKTPSRCQHRWMWRAGMRTRHPPDHPKAGRAVNSTCASFGGQPAAAN
jgi:hypothetical protein